MQNEDSTLFSLDKLTRGTAPTPQLPNGATTPAQSSGDEDSGLIDLARLDCATSSQRTFAVAAPPPLGPFGAPSPLGGVIEESTLNGLVAPEVRAVDALRWRVPAFVGLVLTGAAAIALMLRALLPGEDPAAAPAQTIVVLAPAPPPAEEEPRDADRTDPTKENPSAGGVAAVPTVTPKRDVTPRPGPKPPTRRVNPDKPKPPEPADKPSKPKDPCAHCGGDLSCAMRCSVRGSG